ncbi:MAG: Hsp70 family protein [Sorangiineae bacterium PRO1]|nr:Hsp70 family protein [Sorangiineae bacterium PRO1]
MIGLDFGTTNSCVAIRNAFGSVEPIVVATGNRPPYDTVLRSAVLDPTSDMAVVGEEALQKAETAAAGSRLLVSFKPFLDEHQLRHLERRAVGKEFRFDPLAEAELEVARYESVWVGGEERYSRDELILGSGALLGHLLEQAVEAGGDPSELWLGMPVSFGSCARQRLLASLHEARDSRGRRFFPTYHEVLRSVRFVLEPVAVAAGPIMRDAYDAADAETVLIFDHGGGTLDLSVLRFERHPKFAGLVPTRELTAGGSRDVAGRSIDTAFRDALADRQDFQTAASAMRDYFVNQFVEQCKIRLSDEEQAEALPGVAVTREDFEGAVVPVLDQIEWLVRDVVARAGLALGAIDRVVLTGGSSLAPCVQKRAAAIFPGLDEYRMLTYDPRSRNDAESAITEVARGLVAFADEVSAERTLEHVVLWDIDATMGGRSRFRRVVERGEPYALDEQGRPRLVKRVDVPPNPGQGTSFGLYEHQLGHRYLFGMAEVPPLDDGGVLEIELRPDQITPALRLFDHEGELMKREPCRGTWDSELLTVADLLELPEEAELGEYFESDAEYLPVRGFARFERTPLVRRIRVGDLVEWAIDVDGSGPARDIRRYRGEVRQIWHQGDAVEEMQSLVLEDHRFRVVPTDTAQSRMVEVATGDMRLAARPGRDF